MVISMYVNAHIWKQMLMKEKPKLKKNQRCFAADNKKLTTTLVLQIFLAGGANVALAFKN